LGLENIVNKGMKMKGIVKVVVSSDWHIPYEDKKAFNVHLAYVKNYKPNRYVIAGDMMDFYTLSKFDKSPERSTSFQDEIDQTNLYLNRLKKVLPKSCKIDYLKGNHEARLQKWLWSNPELNDIRALDLNNLLKLKERGIKYTDVSADYWKDDSGHIKIADTLLMHGDNRLNGSTCSKYSGYSASNTMRTMMTSVIHGHGHRLAQVYMKTPAGYLKGTETGCLCKLSGTANWQQGFVTFEAYRGKTFNHRTHHINNGVLIADGKKYTSK